MQKTAVVPAISDAIALLTNALSEGHTVAISLAAQPRVIRAPPLVTACCLQFGLTPSQARVLVALLEHGYLSRPDLHAAMSSGRGASKIKTVDVVINRVRQGLAAHNVAIITVRGAGYRIDEDGRDRLRKLIADYDTDQPNTKSVTT